MKPSELEDAIVRIVGSGSGKLPRQSLCVYIHEPAADIHAATESALRAGRLEVATHTGTLRLSPTEAGRAVRRAQQAEDSARAHGRLQRHKDNRDAHLRLMRTIPEEQIPAADRELRRLNDWVRLAKRAWSGGSNDLT